MTKNAQAGLAAAVVGVGVLALLLVLLGGDDDAPGVPGLAGPGGAATGGATPRPTLQPSGGQLGRPHTGGDPNTQPTPGATPTRSGDPNLGYDPKRFGHKTTPGRGGPVALTFVCTKDGTALPGVRIEAKRRSGMPLEPVVSDGRGRALLRGLPAGEQVSGVARHATSAALRFGPVTVAKGAQVPLRFGAAPQGRLIGTLVDDAGNPVSSGAQLILGAGKSEQDQGAAVLDATALNLRPDGGFTADLAAGTYAISAKGKGLSESDKTYVTVEPNQTVGPISITLRRQGSISGQVSLPTDLQAVADLKLDLVLEITGGTERNPYTRHDRRPLKLDGSSRFELKGCDAGRYRVRLEVPQAGGNRVGPWVRFSIEPGKSVAGIRLNLAEVMVSVQGTVTDQDGRGVEGATISVRGKKVTTDREGRYALRGLNMGSLGIKGSKAGYADDYKQVTYRGARLTVDLSLKEQGAISGKVVGNQSKVANIQVIAVSKDEDGYLTRPATTDGQGTYTITGLSPGTWYLKAGPGARDPYALDGAPSVKVEAGRTTKASDLVLP